MQVALAPGAPLTPLSARSAISAAPFTPSAFLNLDSPQSTSGATSPQQPTTQHHREINPFEQSFAPGSLAAGKSGGGGADRGPMLRGKRVLDVEERENEVQRKRERDAKRPKLRLGLGGVGQPGGGGSTSSATTTSTANSFNSDRSNSSKATTVSPNSSLAPSPVLDVKPDTCSLIASLANSVASAPSQPHFHYQPAPLPITLNPSQPALAQSFYPASSIPPTAMQPMAFAPFAPDSLSDYYSGSSDEYASLAPTLINPVALPELPVPPPLDLPASVIAEEAGPPAPTYAPKKRGRKPKNAPPATAVDLEQDRREALDRNRVAASRSRQRKKERVGNLESTAQDLAASNAYLQSACLSLRAELDSLRALMDTTHPSGCACQHVVGYRAREADGGGIPTIERIAGSVLGRDYGRSSTWGSREAEPVEASQSTSTEVWREESEEVVEELEEVKKNAIPLRRRS